MILKIGIVVLAILGGFLIYVATLSPNYVISREIAIQASAEKIFPYLNNSRLAERWAPWSEIDPAVKMTYSGPDVGVGSRSDWYDGKQLGTGSAVIVESVPNERVGIALEYEKPRAMIQYAQYSIRSSGDQSIVTWKVEGKNNFISRIACMFINVDKMVGSMFEKGLSNLKNLVEK